MEVYKYQPPGSLLDDQTGNFVTLEEVRNQIVKGNSVRILQSRTNEDVTQQILLKVISMDSDNLGDSKSVNDELEALIRKKARKRSKNNLQLYNTIGDDAVLVPWMKLQIAYSNVWARDFGRRYHSLEYLLLICTTFIHHWSQRTLEMETAIQSMKHGTLKTRMNRLENLISEGWLQKVPHSDDRRRFMVVPTPELEELEQNHVIKSLTTTLRSLPELVGMDAEVSTIIEHLESDDIESIQRTYLLPHCEYQLWVLDSWATCVYGYEFFEAELAVVCTHVVISRLIDKPITLEKLNDLAWPISYSVLRTRIEQCIDSKLIVKSKHPMDKRVTVYAPSPMLEVQIKSHYMQRLAQFIALIKQFPTT